MTPLFPALVALLTIFAAGFGIAMFLLRSAPRITISQVAALSWLFGTIAISLGMWLLGMLLRNTALHAALTVGCLGSAIAGIVLFVRGGPDRCRLPLPRTWLETALIALLGVEIAIVFGLTFGATLGWDGLLVWELKARYAFLNGGALPVAYFSDATRAYSHPEYPLYLPMLQTWMYLWLGDCDQYWVKIIFSFFYLVALCLLAEAGAWWSGRRWIGLMLANLFFFVPLLTRGEGGIVNGYADVPLSIFYFAAFYYMSIFAREDSGPARTIFLVLSGALPWIKRDGTILWLVLALCAGWIIWRRRGLAAALLSLLPGLLIIAGWHVYLRQMHAAAPHDFLPLAPSVLFSKIDRVAPVFFALLKEASSFERWSLLWLLAVVAFLCLAWRCRNEEVALLFICTALPVGIYCAAYLFSAWPDYSQHVSSSLRRLLLHVAPLALLAIALAIRIEKRSVANLTG